MKEGKIIGTYGTMHYVLDIDKTVDYYKNKVGMVEINASPEWVEFMLAGGQKICFHSTKDQSLVGRGGIMIINVTNLRGIIDGFKKREVTIFSEIKEVYPGAYTAEFIDCDGHIVSLHEYIGS